MTAALAGAEAPRDPLGTPTRLVSHLFDLFYQERHQVPASDFGRNFFRSCADPDPLCHPLRNMFGPRQPPLNRTSAPFRLRPMLL